jgi:hypothetical protein
MKMDQTPASDLAMAILSALGRLNERSTSRAAAEDLARMVYVLDHNSMGVLVNSIVGRLEPKPFARKVPCTRLERPPRPAPWDQSALARLRAAACQRPDCPCAAH